MADMTSFLTQFEERLQERLGKLAREYSMLRTGRANPHLLESIQIEYYGQQVPLKQVAAISVPEGRVLEIRPWDPGVLQELEKAIQKADLGAMPQNDGKLIRLQLPTMTQERRQEMVKVVKRMAEDHRVALRQARHEALDDLRKAEKAKEISQDDLRSIEGRVQKITDLYVSRIDQEAAAKEKEITTV